MDFFDVIEKRRSIRQYTDAPVSLDDMVRVVEAGRLAPSWKNGQCWRYIVVKDAEIRAEIGTIVNNNPDPSAYTNAPYVLVLCADPDQSGHHNGQDYYMTDVGIALEQSILAAAALGLGTCWIGLFDEEPLKEILNVPEHIRIVALTPLGVPAQDPKPRPRKPTSEIAFSNRWGDAF